MYGGSQSNLGGRPQHYQPSSKYNARDDRAPIVAMRRQDLVHICRSSFDRGYHGYNEAASNNPKRIQAWQDLTDCLERGSRARTTNQVSEQLLQETFAAVDNYFFRGLMRRDKITTIKRKALDGRTAGSTSFTHPEERITAQMMRQKGVHISIDTSSFKDDHQYGTFSDWVGTIMHESCHAVIEIFQCTCDACNATFVAEIGQGGHGTAWTELATAVVERARKSRRLKDTGGDHVRMHHHLHDPTAGMAGIGGQAYGGIFAGGTYDGSPYGGNPYGGNPYGGNPYGGNPYGGSPYGGSPYGRSPHGGSPYGGSPYGGRSGFL